MQAARRFLEQHMSPRLCLRTSCALMQAAWWASAATRCCPISARQQSSCWSCYRHFKGCRAFGAGGLVSVSSCAVLPDVGLAATLVLVIISFSGFSGFSGFLVRRRPGGRQQLRGAARCGPGGDARAGAGRAGAVPGQALARARPRRVCARGLLCRHVQVLKRLCLQAPVRQHSVAAGHAAQPAVVDSCSCTCTCRNARFLH